MIGLGVEPLHFAIIMSVNLTVGTRDAAHRPRAVRRLVDHAREVEVIAREMAPFLVVHMSVILLITYIPELSMTPAAPARARLNRGGGRAGEARTAPRRALNSLSPGILSSHNQEESHDSILRRCGAVAAAAVFCAMTEPRRAQDFVLKYGHVGPVGDDSDDHISGVFLKDFLEGRSQGRIRVDIFPASQLGNFREMIEQVQLGTLELTHTTVGGMASFFPELQVTDIPYMVSNDRLGEEMMVSPFFQEVSDAILEKTGTIRLVATSNTGRWRSFYTTGAEIRTAADMAGIKMRVINSPLQQEFVRFLGGNPTPVAWGELYTSLGTGVVEGTKNAALDIVSNKLNDHLR